MNTDGKPKGRKASLPGPASSPSFLEETLQYVRSTPSSPSAAGRSSRSSVDSGSYHPGDKSTPTIPEDEQLQISCKPERSLSVSRRTMVIILRILLFIDGSISEEDSNPFDYDRVETIGSCVQSKLAIVHIHY